MHTVSVINYKGGVGNTTLTANIGAELAFRGKNVLLIDLDPQASLTFSFISPDEWATTYEQKYMIKSWFDSLETPSPMLLTKLTFAPQKVKSYTGAGNLHIVYSHLGLLNVDLELATKLGGANLKQTKKNFISVHNKLREGLKEYKGRGYDIILIDCPPNFNIVTKNAIVASSSILVPARPDHLSTLGIDYLIRSVDTLVTEYNEFCDLDSDGSNSQISPKLLGVVFTMIKEHGGAPISAQQEYITKMRQQEHLRVFDSYVKHNDTLFASASQYGVPVVLIGQSQQTYKNVISSLEQVTSEFRKLLSI